MLPLDDAAQQRLGEDLFDVALVAVAIVLERLVELVPVHDAIDHLLRLRRLRRRARFLLRLRGKHRGEQHRSQSELESHRHR